jgi:cytochrome b subunit of formate dehydrogenase
MFCHCFSYFSSSFYGVILLLHILFPLSVLGSLSSKKEHQEGGWWEWWLRVVWCEETEKRRSILSLAENKEQTKGMRSC